MEPRHNPYVAFRLREYRLYLHEARVMEEG
jgi:hypothetical protein